MVERVRSPSMRFMKLVRGVVVFDAADLGSESAFWAGMLGGQVFEDETWHTVIDAEGKWRVGIQLAPNHVAPEWPDGNPQQVHLDLHVEDPRAAHDEAMALGSHAAPAGARPAQRRRASGLCRSSRAPLLHRLGTAVSGGTRRLPSRARSD